MPASRRSGHIALMLLLAATLGCGIPRPRFSSMQAIVEPNGPAIVAVEIDPNGTTVSEVHLEWGRRPSLKHQVALTLEDDLPLEITPHLPATDPLAVAWYFRPDLPPDLADDEVVDFQVRLTHSHPDGGNVAHWSPRRFFVFRAPRPEVPLPPPEPPIPGLDPATCSDTTVLVGVHPVPNDEGSSGAVISRDGRFAAFTTLTAFEANDENGVTDVYQMGLTTGTVRRVSAFTTGSDTHGGSQPAISGNGRFVAFVSRAPFDPNAAAEADQVYLWDRDAGPAGGVVARVSNNHGFDVDLGGTGPSLSHDGRFVAFESRTRFQADPQADVDAVQVYLWERNTSNIAASQVVARVSANGGMDVDRGGRAPVISGDGNFVAFASRTRFPIDPQANDEVDQVYLWERAAGAVTARVSGQGGTDVDRGGAAPTISGGGRFVAFVSTTRYPVDPQATVDAGQIYLWDRDAGRVVARVTANGDVDVDRGGGAPSISADGMWVAFVSRTRFPDFEIPDPAYDQVYLWDRAAGRIVSWISSSSHDVDRGGGAPSLSGDGRLTAFSSLTNFDAVLDVNGVLDAYVRCR